MKHTILITFCFIFVVLFSAVGAAAQDEKGKIKKMDKEMSMAEMHQSPHHKLMTAYRQTLVTFAAVLRDAAKTDDALNADFARESVAEIRRSSEKMKEIHQKHAAKMKPEMRASMAEMMQKMEQQQKTVEEHIAALENLVRANVMNSKEIEKHAARLAAEFGKVEMPDENKMKEKNMKKNTN